MRHVSSFLAAVLPVAIAISVFTPSAFGQSPPAGLSITNYQIVSEQRISINQSYYTLRADLVNSGPARSALTATATSKVPTIEVQGLGNLHFAPIAANSQAPSLDTFTILVDRTVPLDYANLQWSFVAPVANAGPNQTASIGVPVTLNGSASTNPSGIGFLSYAWTFVSRPAGTSARIFNSSDVITSFTPDVLGDYIVKLTVTNGVGTDIALITVTSGNTAPVANAGPNQTAAIGATVQLNGSASSDVDGDPLTYSWTLTLKPSGSTATLNNATIVNPTFIADKAGTYTAQLVVNDGHSNSAPSTVTITTGNTPPVANAGPNQVVTVGALVQLNGSASTDVDGDSLIFSWSLITRPAGSTAALSNTAAVNPTFTADQPGTYVAQLVVNDGKVNSAAATVTISTGTVQQPTANAGPNQTVQHGNIVTLHGSGTDPQSLPLSFHWSLTSQPLNSTAALSSPTAQNPTFLADLPGTYVAQLIVNNGSVNSNPSTVTVTTTNTAPVAGAGVNQTVATGATVSLNGIGSTDADADPLTYSWSFSTRPSGSNATLINANTATPSFIADVTGTYLVQLIVSDPFTASNPATVTITAGSRTITLSPDPLNLFGAVGTFTVSLLEPAAAGGQQITFNVLDTSVATLPPSVIIPANALSVTVPVTPVSIGSTIVTASAPGFRPGFATVNVSAQSISVTLGASSIGVTKTTTGTVTLSSPASAAGALINLSANPSGIVTLQPSSFTIAPGGTTGTFTVTGAAEGSSTISAASPGYNTGSANIQVGKLGLITIQPNVTVGPGQSVPLPVTLITPAPVGGATITLSSSNTGKLTVTASIFIAQGQTAPDTPAQVTGVDFGSATVTASSPGFTGDSQTVTVAASLTFTPSALSLGIGATQNITLQLSAPAPAALTVTLSSSNSGVASVPGSVNIAQNATSVQVPVTAGAAGSATITATPGAANVVGATASVNVLSFGTVVLPGGVTIGLGQSTPVQVSLSANAPAGGVTVTLNSSDSSIASLSASSVFIPAGTNAPVTQPVINGVAPGSVTISASAPGFASASGNAQVVASFALTPPSLSITVGSTANLTVTLSAPAPAGGQLVNLTSTNTAVATVPSTVTIPQNTTTAPVPVTGVGAGSTTIRAAAASVNQATSSVTVQSAGTIGLPGNVTIAPGQSVPFPVTLPSPAPSDLTVSLASSDTGKVTIAPASLTILAGQTQPATQPQVTGINFGASLISASAPGYGTGSQTVQVAGALSFAVPGITVAGGSFQVVTLNLSAPAGPGGLSVTLGSNSASATVPGSVSIAQNTSSITFAVTGVSAGSAVITATAGAPNVSGATLNVTVTGGGNIGLPPGLVVGLGQSAVFPISLPVAAPAGGVVVTLSSGDTSKVTIAPTSVNIQGGQTSPSQQPLVTGVGLGSANITASAPGFGSASVPVQVSGTMSLTPATLTINGTGTQNLTLTLSSAAPAGGLTVNLQSGNTGVATVAASVTVAQNTTTAPVPVTGVAPGTTTITASAANLSNATATVNVIAGADILLPSGLVVSPGDNPVFTVTLARAATESTFVSLESSDTSKATLSTQNLFFNIGQTTPTSQPRINGISPGTVTITASAFGLNTATTSVLIGFGLSFSPANLTITGQTTQNLTLSLTSSAPQGLQVNLSSSNPGVATVNSTIFIPPNIISISVPVTGVAPGSTVITASSQNVPAATANVTVANPGTIGAPATTNVALGQSAPFPITLSTPAPGGGVTVALSSTNTGRATISPSTVFIAAGQTQPASQPQVSAVNVGAATINATAPGYASGAGVVQVGATVTFTEQNLTIGVNSSQILHLALSASAPLAGLTVQLTSGNPVVATLQSSVNFFPDGSAFTTVAIPVQGLSPGTSVIHAAGVNIPDATVTVTVVGPVTFTTTSLANGSVGTPYSQTLAAAGGSQPYTFTLISGALPNPLGLNASTGQISGTPTSPATNTPLTFRVTDSSAPNQTATVNLTLTIVSQSPASITATSGTPQSTLVNTQFSAPLVATVKDGSNNLVSGVTVTFNAPGSGPSGSFAGGANSAVTNGSGQATSAVFIANGTPGTYNVTASVAGAGSPATFALTNTSPSPGSITPNSGTPQSATINTAFAAPFTALVKDGNGNPLAGVTVTFLPPASGPGGSFAGGLNTAVTNAFGIATSAAFTANSITGNYPVNASTPGIASIATFQLTNTAGPPDSIVVVSGTPQSAAVNTTFAAPLVVQVKDAGGNPANGVTVTFRAPFSGPSGDFASANTAITNSQGIATSGSFTANGNQGSYTVNAFAAGILFPVPFSLTNTNGSGGGGPQLAISGGSVGQGLQVSLTLTLPAPAPAPTPGNFITVSTGNPNLLLLAGRPGDSGTTQLQISVPEGLTTVNGIYAQALGNSGTVTVSVSAPGFTTGIATVTLSTSGFVLAGPNGIGGSFSITQGSSAILTVSPARLDSSNAFVEVQQVRGGSFVDVTLGNSPQSLGTVTPTVTFNGGDSSKTATFTATTQTTGDTTITAQAFGFTPPINGANSLVATVTPTGIVAPIINVGQNLQSVAKVSFLSPVPAGGMTLTLTSGDASKVLFSKTVGDPGLASIIMTIGAGFNNSPDFYVQALAGSGSVSYTAVSTALGNASGAVVLASSGLSILGPFGMGQNFFTTSGASNSNLTIFTGMLSGGVITQLQPVRAGLNVNVTVTSSNPSVGAITSSPVTITGPADSVVTQFDPATAGTATLSASATGFQGQAIVATVTTPQMSIPNLTVGRNLQQPGFVLAGQAAPAGGTAVTLTSNSAQLRLSASPTAAGLSSIVVTIPAGGTSAIFYAQALTDTGTGSYMATATGFAPKTGTITFAPSGVAIAGPFGFGFPLNASVSGPDQPVTVFTVLLDPNNGNNIVSTQQLAGGSPLSVTLTNSTPGVGTVISPVSVVGGSDSGTTQFHPVSPGQGIISIVKPANFSLPGDSTTLTFVVN